MKRSDCNRKCEDELLSKSADRVSSISRLQTAETLEEINQKTLTIRDQFAIAALQGMLSGQFPDEMDEYSSSSRAYILADAMLEARKS